MITSYALRDGKLLKETEEGGEGAGARLEAAVWIDLLDPTPEEEALIERVIGAEMPSREEMQEIEVSSRLYVENEAFYLTATVVAQADSEHPVSSPVGFILAGHRLVTLRHAEPRPFKTFAQHVLRHPHVCKTGEAALTGLLDEIVDRLADILEAVQAELEKLSREVFDTRAQRRRAEVRNEVHFQEILRRIGRYQGLTSRVRESLVSVGRVVSFLGRPGEMKTEKQMATRLKTLARDVQSLSDHASYLAGNITFLLSATLGMINIRQTTIVKIFSIAAVIFLPPTMVATIYGMNFRFMPELDWPIGYPLAIALMIASAILPYWYFKRKGWL